MAVRRSSRIAELEAKKKGLVVAPKKARRSEELVKAENDELKDELKKIRKTLKETKNRLVLEQGTSTTLERRARMMESMKRRVTGQNEELRKLLEMTTETLEGQTEKIQEQRRQIPKCENHEEKVRAVEKEMENTMKLRNEYLAEAEKYSKQQEEENGGPLPWRLCDICAFPFGKDEPRVPRVLKCGHTICTGCAEHFRIDFVNSIRCPFDRQIKLLGEKGVEGLPKNLVLLNL